MIEERTKLCNRKNAKTGQNINAIETAHGIGNENGNKKMDKTPSYFFTQFLNRFCLISTL